MKYTLSKVLSLLIVLFVLIIISIPIQAADDPMGILKPDTDSKGFQALKMTVTSIASTAPLQAFCEGWNFTFSFGSESIDLYVPLLVVNKNGGSRTYTFALTSEYSKDTTGIKGAKSIRDLITNSTDKATFDRIIKAGATAYVNARIQKYSYSNTTGKFTELGEFANVDTEIDSKFSEFTSTFKSNTKKLYYNLNYTFKPQSVPAPDPKVNLSLPINGSTVLQGTVVTFKGFGTGVHHISGFVDGEFLEEQGNPNEDINEQMLYETTVKLDEIRDYTFQIKGRNTANSTDAGSKLAESAIHTVHVIKPPANSGSIYIKCFDIDTSKEIPDTAQEIPGVEFGKPKTVTYTPVTSYKVQGSYQTFSNTAIDKSKMQTATSQTVTLSSINNNAYVYFGCKFDSTVTPPKPPTKINLDPIAIINSTSVAYAGDDVLIDGSRSYDEDGYIEHYYWNLPGTYSHDQNNTYENSIGDNKKGTAWYPNVGIFGLDLEVVDDGNASGYDQSIIEIIEPKPEVVIDVLADKMKENRKITLDISKSKSATRFPIDWTSATWSIQPVNGTGASGDYGVRLQDGSVYKNVGGKAHLNRNGSWTDTGMDFNSVLKGQKAVYFQARDSGQYKVTVSLTNTSSFNSAVHFSNSLERTITIVEDLAPIADYDGAANNICDIDNPIDKTLPKYGIMPIQCTSTSPDGDPIGKRVWAIRYDSDNDREHGGSITESYNDETTIYPYTGNDPFAGVVHKTDAGIYMTGIRLVVDGEKDNVAEIWTYEDGKYTVSLQVFEDIPDNETVKELLIPSDFKSGYVQGW